MTSGAIVEDEAGFELDPSPSQKAMQERLHALARDELRAQAAAVERDGADARLIDRVLADGGIEPTKVVETGFDDPHTPLIALEELAYGDAGVAWATVPALQIATIVGSCGTDDQRRDVSAALAADGATASVLLYEDFGRQPSEYETRVTTTGTAAAINGRKSSVIHPGAADVALIVATEEGALAAFALSGPTGVIADPTDDGVGRVAFTALPTGTVRIDDLPVEPGERLAGGVALERAVGHARLLVAACLLGITRASVEFACAYATQRTTWDKPLSEYQGVSFPLIELATELLEVRLLTWDVAARLNVLTDTADIEDAVARAVSRASSLALRATRDGVQLIGVRGISRDLPCERWYRQAAALAVVDFDVLHNPFGLN